MRQIRQSVGVCSNKIRARDHHYCKPRAAFTLHKEGSDRKDKDCFVRILLYTRPIQMRVFNTRYPGNRYFLEDKCSL